MREIDGNAQEVINMLEMVSWGEMSWDTLLKNIVELFSECGIHTIHHRPRERKAIKVISYGLDDGIVNNYEKYFISIDPWAHYIAGKPNGYIFNSTLEMPYTSFMHSEYYVDHFNNIDDRRDCIGVKYKINNEDNIFIGMHHSQDYLYRSGINLVKFMSDIKNPFYHAARNTGSDMDRASLIASQMLMTVFSKNAGMIVREDFLLVDINSEMERLLSGTFSYGIDKKIKSNKNKGIGPLIIKNIVRICQPGEPTEISFKMEISGRTYLFSFIRINPDFCRPVLYEPSLILITAKLISGDAIVLNREVLKQVYLLTNTEILLCQKLMDGNNLRTAADIVGISYEHARQRLKSIMQKTSTSSQSVLMVLLARVSI